jgi:cell division protein FtsQ
VNATVLSLPRAGRSELRAGFPVLPRAVVPLLLTAALLFGVLLLGHALRPMLDRPLRAVQVQGEFTHLSAEQIAAAAALDVNARVLDVDLPAVRQRIEALPWVGRARVTRVWPDRLALRVWERQPYARWNEDAMVDTDARSFVPPAKDLAMDLPRLAGPAGREAELMRANEALGTALDGSPFVPAGLALDVRGEWSLRTARGITLRLGSEDPLAKTALILGAVSSTLGARLDQVEAIDLRYTNGFAVAWVSREQDQCLEGHSIPANTGPGRAVQGCGQNREVAPGTVAAPAGAASSKPSLAAQVAETLQR